MKYVNKMKIPLILAPMAGYTDFAFRQICRNFGAEYTVSEMISAKALHYKDEKTATLAKLRTADQNTAVQIFGSEPEIMAEAAEKLSFNSYHGCTSEIRPIAIDVNMGCPMRKIVSNGEGSALMKNPDLIFTIVRAMCAATPLPVTVKLRTGWDSRHLNAVECALAAKEGGAKAITIHGRTKEQLYAPPVDLATIAAVKRAVGDLPVIGNGGIASGKDAIELLEATGCDGLMIGQGAIGNPWIFSEVASALGGSESTPQTPADKVAVAKDHLRLLAAEKGEFAAVRESRHHLVHYIKGFRGGAEFREKINHIETLSDLLSEMDRLIAQNAERH